MTRFFGARSLRAAFFVTLSCWLGAIAFAAPANASIDLAPCDLTDHEGRREVDAQCGTLAVPLDRGDPDGETIELAIAVVQALADEPAPDPVVVIAGGPGRRQRDSSSASRRPFRASRATATSS